MTSSLDQSLAGRLDVQWAHDAPSKAARAALAARAICELPEHDQGPWGARIASCLDELSSASRDSPLSPDGAPGPVQDAGLAGHLGWGLISLVATSASLGCCMDTLRALRASGSNLASCGHTHASSLAEASLTRMAQAQQHDSMEEIFTMGFLPEMRHLTEWLCHGGAVMGHPKLAGRIAAIFSHPDLGKNNYSYQPPDNKPLAARFFPHDFYCCPHPGWRQMLISAFSVDEPTLPQLGNLLLMMSGARYVIMRSPERVQQAREAHEADRNRGTRSWISFDDGMREAAQKFHDCARGAYNARLALLARSQPSVAAQVIMETMAPGKDMGDAWENAGLSKVDAAPFLFQAFSLLPKHGVQVHRQKGKIWPLSDDRAQSNLRLAQGIELGYLDCLALSGTVRAVLQSEVDRGARPTAGLAAALDIPSVARQFSEDDALWLCSFVGNPTPSKAKRILKA